MATSYEDSVHRAIEKEVSEINQFLHRMDCRKKNTTLFVAGLQLAVDSIISAIENAKKKYSQEVRNVKEENRKESPKKSCEKKQEEAPKLCEANKEHSPNQPCDMLEEYVPDNEAEEEKKSLAELEDLKDAGESVQLDCRDNVTQMARPTAGFPSYFAEFLREFLADFHKKLQESSAESEAIAHQSLALAEEKKFLLDISHNLSGSIVVHDQGGPEGKERKTSPSSHGSKGSVTAQSENSLTKDTDISIPQKEHGPKTEVPTGPSKDNNDSKDYISSEKKLSPHQCLKGGATSKDHLEKSQSKSPEQKDSSYDSLDGLSPTSMHKVFGVYGDESTLDLPPPSPYIVIQDSFSSLDSSASNTDA